MQRRSILGSLTNHRNDSLTDWLLIPVGLRKSS